MTRAVLARVEPVVGPPGTLLDIHATNAPFSHLPPLVAHFLPIRPAAARRRSMATTSPYGRPACENRIEVFHLDR